MKILASCLLVCLASFSIPSYAICRSMTPEEAIEATDGGTIGVSPPVPYTISPSGPHELDPDTPVGTEFLTADATVMTKTRYLLCRNPGGKLLWELKDFKSSTLANVYETNVPGIGFKLAYISSGGAKRYFPTTSDFTVTEPENQIKYGELWPGAKFELTLVKTGDIKDSISTVQFGYLGYIGADDDKVETVQISSDPVVIKILPSCRVDTPNMDIDFGEFGPRDVSLTEGPTRPVEFKLHCSGPTPPVSISASLSATPDPENADLIQNSGAEHLGIRLRDKIGGTTLKPNDADSTLTQSPGGAMNASFNLEATVLRTGSERPTAGRIDAVATITLTVL
jgi:type 1 fimbria pilin